MAQTGKPILAAGGNLNVIERIRSQKRIPPSSCIAQ